MVTSEVINIRKFSKFWILTTSFWDQFGISALLLVRIDRKHIDLHHKFFLDNLIQYNFVDDEKTPEKSINFAFKIGAALQHKARAHNCAQGTVNLYAKENSQHI